MNKCWFVLEQSIFHAPQYEKPSKAGGKAVGGLRLGDIVPSPKDLYPVLTQGTLPLFGPEMRISSTKVGNFSLQTTSDHDTSGSAGADAPIAAAAGLTVGTELNATFKKTMKTWAEFKTLDAEIVQPTKTYIDGVLKNQSVKDHIDRNKTLLVLNRWTVYIITGLLIARVGGKVGHSESSTTSFGGEAEVDVEAVAGGNLEAHHSHNKGSVISSEIQGDTIWAVRFAKVHKGLLSPKWQQTEETIGAALDGQAEQEEKVEEVLSHEGIADFEIVEAESNDKSFVFITGVIKKAETQA